MSVPGLRNIVIQTDALKLCKEERKDMLAAIDNSKSAILGGLLGIGGILGAAGAGNHGIDEGDVANVGWLIAEMTHLLFHIADLETTVKDGRL